MNELSPGTLKDYRGYVKNYFGFFNGLDVAEITLEHLTNFRDTLSGVSIKTRKNVMNALRNFFFWLKERGVLRELPVFPKVKGDDSKPRRAIGVDLQDEALARIPDAHKGIIEFLMETGLRPGEACALLCEHIDLRAKAARIDRTFSGSKLRTTTKQKRKRVIPLSERARAICVNHLRDKLPKQYLFVNPNSGKHYIPDTLWRIWDTHAGIEGVTLYEATRHSFGSQLIQNNDVTLVKELMGHSDIRTTEQYIHAKLERLSDAVNTRRLASLRRTEIRTDLELPSEGTDSNDFNKLYGAEGGI